MLAAMLADTVVAASPSLPKGVVLVPVPASRAAILRRGFNPAAEIARCLSTQLRLPCRPGLLRRTREGVRQTHLGLRSEEHTSELQSLMRISYAVFCLKKKKKNYNNYVCSNRP